MPVAVGGSFFYFVSLEPYLIRNNLYTIQGGNELWQKPEKFNVCIMCAKETVILEKTVHFVISVRPGGKPARTDNRRQKMKRIQRKERY